MARLVVLSAGLAGRMHELKVDKTTVGRVEDNTFQIAEPSVSSHHCEILLRGEEVLVKDLNSTNGTFINGEKVSESILKPGQTLRLGQVEMKLEPDGNTAAAPAPAAAAAAPAPAKKPVDQTVVMPRGVSLNELTETGSRIPGFDTTSHVFKKKKSKTNKWFLIGGILVFVVAAIVFVGILLSIKK